MTFNVERYRPDQKAEWDALVARARNSVFLHFRDYMEYHADRFEDCSAIVRKGGKTVAAFPASLGRDGHVSSHAGLTFGGLLVDRTLRGEETLECLDALLDALRDWGGRKLTVRLLPAFLQTYPSADVDYGFWRRNLPIVRRDLSSVLPLTDGLEPNRSKLQAIASAENAGISVETVPVADFHALLAQVLRDRHAVEPVHTKHELERLAAHFPENIFVRGALLDGELLAGALVYRYGATWHTQYLASAPAGRKIGALDAVIAATIEEARSAGARWLSFGISTTDAGQSLNEGLLWQKESFGARSVTHDVIEAEL